MFYCCRINRYSVIIKVNKIYGIIPVERRLLMIKTEKGTSESLECIKKYQKELDEYIHSEKIKDDLGRLLGGFVPLESLITSAKFAETEYQTFLGLMKITDLAKTLKEINNTIESVFTNL